MSRALLVDMLHDWINGAETTDAMRKFAWERFWEMSAPPPEKSTMPPIPKAGELTAEQLVEYVRAQLEARGK